MESSVLGEIGGPFLLIVFTLYFSWALLKGVAIKRHLRVAESPGKLLDPSARWQVDAHGTWGTFFAVVPVVAGFLLRGQGTAASVVLGVWAVAVFVVSDRYGSTWGSAERAAEVDEGVVVDKPERLDGYGPDLGELQPVGGLASDRVLIDRRAAAQFAPMTPRDRRLLQAFTDAGGYLLVGRIGYRFRSPLQWKLPSAQMMRDVEAIFRCPTASSSSAA